MEKQLLTMRDEKKIYVQIYDKGHKDFLLMLHGGPGQGCYDFQYQAAKLSESVNVIIFDQRGVLRSDKIEANEPFGLEHLIDDCENIKSILGINSWSILGHSFGGMLALLYAAKYPKSVDKIIFESPSFNLPMSINSLYLKAIEIAETQGKLDYANELREFINNDNDLKFLTDNVGQIPDEIRDEVYYNCDPICCKEQQEYYIKNSKNSKIIMFDKSGHTPHNDEPYKFTDIVIDFLH